MKRHHLFALVALVVVILVFVLREQSLDLETLRSQLEAIGALRDARPFTFVAVFLLFYVSVTALSLPIAVWLTLAAGALFGFWWGLLFVSFASTIGATLAFLTARFLLRDWVRAKLGDRTEAIDAGLRRDGPFYLFTLRLIPVIPFFAVNLVMGLTPISTLTFYIVSQLGMLAGTAVYVNAGTQLAALDSLAGILSPQLLLSFALLGLFPWLARMVLAQIERRRHPERAGLRQRRDTDRESFPFR